MFKALWIPACAGMTIENAWQNNDEADIAFRHTGEGRCPPSVQDVVGPGLRRNDDRKRAAE
jgi:hypothetical protein